MKTPKLSAGQWVVIIIVGAGILGCALTWRNYTKMRPSTLEAKVVSLSPVEIHATFPEWVIQAVQPGAIAWVSSSQTQMKAEGLVVDKNGGVLIRVADSRFRPDEGEDCQVTVNLEQLHFSR